MNSGKRNKPKLSKKMGGWLYTMVNPKMIQMRLFLEGKRLDLGYGYPKFRNRPQVTFLGIFSQSDASCNKQSTASCDATGWKSCQLMLESYRDGFQAQFMTWIATYLNMFFSY